MSGLSDSVAARRLVMPCAAPGAASAQWTKGGFETSFPHVRKNLPLVSNPVRRIL